MPDDVLDSWSALPAGARAALDRQWEGVGIAASLPCGSSVCTADGVVLSSGRNRAYDPATCVDPLEDSRLAHAEFNALALVPTRTDHGSLVLWSTQHPCAMCAAAVHFAGVGTVRYLADDPSDLGTPEEIAATRRGADYRRGADSWWVAAANLLFLTNGARERGEDDQNVRNRRHGWPKLTGLALGLAADNVLGDAAANGTSLPGALQPWAPDIAAAAAEMGWG